MIHALTTGIPVDKFLVIGGEGQLGSNLVLRLRKAGRPVHATYITNMPFNAEQSFLDLGTNIGNWQSPGDFKTCFLCAAVTSAEFCRAQPVKSRKINVENTLKVAGRLSETGAALFFPSTNLVFDGTRPFQQVCDPVNPRCEYGRQKVDTERGLTALTDRVSIIRFTKIIGPNFALIRNWMADLRNGQTIHPFSDMVLSPVSLRFATEAIIAIMRQESYGTWHVSAGEDVSYEQIARYLAGRMGLSQGLIEPIKAAESGLVFEAIPKYTTLDTSRLTEELGLELPSVWETLDEIAEAAE
jgi:dTDP-4-dehydrorhamnose reductase